MRKHLPNKEFFIGKTLPSRPDIQIVELKASGCNAHLFRGHSSDLKRDLACKIIPRLNLHKDWRDEVHKADVLTSVNVVKFSDIGDWGDVSKGIDCVVLISDFVQGVSLLNFMSKNGEAIDVAFIVDWLSTMLNLFNEMLIKDVIHGDFHSGNILVEDRHSYDLLSPRHIFKVTDFGVAEATSDHKFKDDYQQLAYILQQLLEKIDYSAQSPKDKFIFKRLRDHFLARHLVETDLTRDPLARQPAELLRNLLDLDAEFARASAREATKLLTPFDFLSCEQIGEAPSLLHALYSDRFLGLSEIQSQNNVVVTGPRGCGKTTVFRSQSLDQKLRIGEAAPDKVQSLGLYYRCDDLYFAFPRYSIPTRDEAFNIPIHFVTATLLSRLLDSVEAWARQFFIDEFRREESRTADALWGALGIAPPPTPGSASFRAIIARLNNERLKAVDRQRFANDPKRTIGMCFGPDVLMKTCGVLTSNLSFVSGKPIYFFIDDYSSPKISKDLQANLNRIFMHRSSVCFFKLSTESPVSFAKYDIDGKNFVENREFALNNLGSVYLHAEMRQKLTFIEDVFRRRLAQSKPDFPATELKELVGDSSEQVHNEVARRIRAEKKLLLNGRQTLCSLCSGDIHYVIGLVGNMVRLFGGPEELAKSKEDGKIPPEIQNRAIREAAGGFLKNLRGTPKYGEKLVSIVEAFGNVSHSHLRYADSKNEEGSPPKQASRIEPYEPFTMSEKARQLYDELLRYAVFIEDFRGKSRRGNVVPRLYLRRFLIPHFNLTFSMRDSIEIEPDDFETFLLDPKKFEQKHRFKSVEDAKKLQIDENQLELGLDASE
ncbi:MAG: protein kinase family protein [Nitrospira sp.]|nr:protein kinase family protein [Bacteroidota bacterium]MBX3339690.1 protein kinase family protein [Nitrospira sp.]MCW5780242.1 protein kinase family protein [Nitrospira sp.]